MKTTIELTVPVTWMELSTKQLEFLSKLLIKGADETEIMTRCFIEFSGLKLIKKAPVEIDHELNYIFKKKGSQRFPLDVDRATWLIEKMNYLVNKAELFKLPERIKKYVPVNFSMYGVTLEQYILLDQHYARFLDTKDPDMLTRMVAIVYHKPDEKWGTKKLDQLVKRFKRVPLFRKYIVFLWFTAIKAWFIQKYWFVFNSAESSSDQPADEIIMGLVSALNEGNITLNETILQTDVHQVMFELNRKIERSKDV